MGTREERGARNATLLFAVALLAMNVDVLSQADFVGGDFKSFYYACRAAALRIDFYDLGQLQGLAARDGTSGVFPFLYPPAFPFLFAWLSRLRLPHAQLLWSLASIAALTVALAVSVTAIRRRQRSLGGEPVSWSLALTLGVGLTLALNLRNVVSLGQINLLILLFVVPCLMLPGEPRHLPCALLALAILIKVTPIFLIPVLLAERRFRGVLRVAGWLTGWAALSLVLRAGPQWRAFARFAPQMSYGSPIPGLFPADASCNFSVAGFYARLTESPHRTFWLTAVSLGVLTLPVLYAASRRPADDSGIRLSAYVLVIIGAPVTYVHHVIMLLPVLLWASSDCMKGPGSKPALIVALGIIAGTDFPVLYTRFHWSHAAYVGVSSLNLYALLALYVLGLIEAARVATEARSPPSRLVTR